MKKSATPEQKARAEARRERFKGLCKELAAMTDLQRAELTQRVGAVLTCEGRELSLTNTLLLMLQCPGVSVVGGFRQWIKAGRCVRKGERSHSIWIPTGAKNAGAEGGAGGTEASLRELVEAGEGGRTRFITGSVFDISQTEELQAGGPVAVDEDDTEGLCAPPGSVPVLPEAAPVVLEVVRAAEPVAVPVRALPAYRKASPDALDLPGFSLATVERGDEA